jgi:hypothetical protein
MGPGRTSKRQEGCWLQVGLQTEKGVDDKVERYKERLVAKGYSQKEGIDFHEIFSPVVNLVSVCVVLALVSLLDLELE